MSSWFSGVSSVGGSNDHRSRARSHHSRRSSSPKSYFSRPHQDSSSTRGFFSRSYSSSSSYYKRRPRDGYVARMIYQLKKLLRDLYDYARRHPVKVFMLVVMPLITGGALHNILRQFGVRLPTALAGFGAGNSFAGSSGFGGSSFGGRGGGFGDLGGGGLQSAMSIAKMFM